MLLFNYLSMTIGCFHAGIETVTAHCRRQDDGSPVPDNRCDARIKPNTQVYTCKKELCPATWVKIWNTFFERRWGSFDQNIIDTCRSAWRTRRVNGSLSSTWCRLKLTAASAGVAGPVSCGLTLPRTIFCINLPGCSTRSKVLPGGCTDAAFLHVIVAFMMGKIIPT